MKDIQAMRDVQMVGKTEAQKALESMREEFYKPDMILAALFAQQQLGDEGVEMLKDVDPEVYQSVKKALKEVGNGKQETKQRPLR